MNNQNVTFTFHYAGAAWEVSANFSQFSETPSADYDSEWNLDNIEVIGRDGMDCHGELEDVFVRKFASVGMVSLASVIEDQARKELE